MPDTCSALVQVIQKGEPGSVRLWTFGGTRANRTIAKKIQSAVEVKRVDALGIGLKTPLDAKTMAVDFLISGLECRGLRFLADEVKERAKSIKFAACLPESLLMQIICHRQFEPFAHSPRRQAECKSGFAALITSDLLPLLPLQPQH